MSLGIFSWMMVIAVVATWAAATGFVAMGIGLGLVMFVIATDQICAAIKEAGKK